MTVKAAIVAVNDAGGSIIKTTTMAIRRMRAMNNL
jgi:hypothetical protein